MGVREGFGVCIVLILLNVTAFSDNVPASYNPPDGLAATNVPLFVVMGFDDCQYPDGMTWTLDLLKTRKNPAGNNNQATFDGTQLHASFYLTSVYGEDDPLTVVMWKQAAADGHEISCHTQSHGDQLNGASQQVWLDEMKACNSWIEKNLGIPQNQIWGFRTPFLAVSQNSFTAEDKVGFLYDCSVMHTPKDYDWIFVWPYTLDNDLAPDAQKKMGKYPGLWEIPVYNVVEAEGGFPNMCGMDYSMWAQRITADVALNWLKWSLDIRLKDGKNRAPFTLGMHPDLYSPSNQEQLVLSWPANLEQRKKTIIDFVDYALKKPMVRFVSTKQLIDWMRKPVGLDGTSGVKNDGLHAASKPGTIRQTAPRAISITMPCRGLWTVELYSVNGRHVGTLARRYYSIGTVSVGLPHKYIPAGIYMVRLSGERKGSIEQRITIY